MGDPVLVDEASVCVTMMRDLARRWRFRLGARYAGALSPWEVRGGVRSLEEAAAVIEGARAPPGPDLARLLFESEERFRLLVDAVQDYAIVMLDPTGRVASWNRGAERLKQYRAEEILGQHFSLFFPPEDRAAGRPAEALATAAVTGRYQAEVWSTRKDGTRILCNFVITPLLDSGPRPLGYAVVSRDVTAQHALEARLGERSAELEAANRELQSFTYSASHELRAPLRAATGFAELLEQSAARKLDEGEFRLLARIREATARMSELVEGLLTLARVTRAPLRREPVDLAEVARGIAAELADREPGRSVEWVIPETLPTGGDPRLLRIALDALLQNAWTFTRRVAAPRIELGVCTDEARDWYFVRDNGPGFDAAGARTLFQPFEHVCGDAELEGTGIGLASVQRIVQRHGGEILAQSSPGAGATFVFTLRGPVGAP